jgi:hypothetical protein
MKTYSILFALTTLLPLIVALPTKTTIAETGVSPLTHLVPAMLSRTDPSSPKRQTYLNAKPHAQTMSASKTLIATDGAAGTVICRLDIVLVRRRRMADRARLMLNVGRRYVLATAHFLLCW